MACPSDVVVVENRKRLLPIGHRHLLGESIQWIFATPMSAIQYAIQYAMDICNAEVCNTICNPICNGYLQSNMQWIFVLRCRLIHWFSVDNTYITDSHGVGEGEGVSMLFGKNLKGYTIFVFFCIFMNNFLNNLPGGPMTYPSPPTTPRMRPKYNAIH
jgi:hypothetical protein